ncbi:dihydropteroate synthase [Humidisolicoccus flavus]|uniref:dihydropteroate synthase n=1 Tax=Humidisolicoccus flavus TaxID=3111414 RepID=UPI0032547E82
MSESRPPHSDQGTISPGVRPEIWGILNVTPDSFSDGGRYVDAGAAIAHARRMRLQGADVIDVGGESTRPGAVRVPPAEEQARVLPVIRELSAEGFTVSIDTYNASTARAASLAGASIVNDVSGATLDSEMAATIAELGTRYVLTHARGADVTKNTRYADVVSDVAAEIELQRDRLIQAGVHRQQLILDPGLGFSKDGSDNWALLAGIPRLKSLGSPVLIGASRKRFLGALLPADAPMEARDAGSAAVALLAAQAGADAVRVHDVVQTSRVLDVFSQFSLVPTNPADDAASVTASGRSIAANDMITLTGLEAFAHHGVFEHEREHGQRFVVDVVVWLDASRAGASDDLAATVHYGLLAEDVVAAVESSPVDLIETVAERIAAVVLRYEAAQRTRVVLHKPSAPISVPFADVSITIERSK